MTNVGHRGFKQTKKRRSSDAAKSKKKTSLGTRKRKRGKGK